MGHPVYITVRTHICSHCTYIYLVNVGRRGSRRHQFHDKSNWEQYREIFEAIVCSNGWDDVTAVLQLLSHLGGDALNVALLVPASGARIFDNVIIRSLQLSGASGGIQASVSAGGPAPER